MPTLGPAPGGPGGLAAAAGDLLVGAAEGDDAAVLRLDEDRALVLTPDFFTPIVDDARDWGRVAATNAMSDVYAMGGRPVIALNLTAWPGQNLPVELLAEVLRGGSEAGGAGGIALLVAAPAGGTTGPRPRDGARLVLTKPIGTGVVATAHKRGAAPDDVLAGAVDAIAMLNGPASEAALRGGG